jgi:hypothetical protein
MPDPHLNIPETIAMTPIPDSFNIPMHVEDEIKSRPLPRGCVLPEYPDPDPNHPERSASMHKTNKILHLGRVRAGEVFVNVEYTVDGPQRRLSFTGVVGPTKDGDCRGSCGQIVDNLDPASFLNFAPGWDAAAVLKLRETWERWHLNDMTAGSPAQEAWLREHKAEIRAAAKYPVSHYDVVTERLAAAGLNPDLSYLHNGQPYHYGHAWLYEPVPENVISWLAGLPTTTVKPAWV